MSLIHNKVEDSKHIRRKLVKIDSNIGEHCELWLALSEKGEKYHNRLVDLNLEIYNYIKFMVARENRPIPLQQRQEQAAKH